LLRGIICAGLRLVGFVVTNGTSSSCADFSVSRHVTRDPANYRALYAALSLGSRRQGKPANGGAK
jgi:hypothetical protein